MTTYYATPADIQNHLDLAQAGDEIVLRPGTYRNRLRIRGRSGTAARPISLRAEPGAVLDSGADADSFRDEANRKAESVYLGQVPHYPQGSYPGLYPWFVEGQLVLQGCRHVRLLNLVIRQSWPTLIALVDCTDIEIAHATLTDGTFAIGAEGKDTARLFIHDCTWVQDVVPHRMWRDIDWRRIHGTPDDEDHPWPIDVVNDWRQFDGDFFRGHGIRGGVRVLHCSVTAAFNAIHCYNPSRDLRLCRDFEVAHCTFREIRDNVFESEDVAHNWWFHHNEIVNAHKWFSIEQKKTGSFYFFANRAWYDEIQGPDGDNHAKGGVFKTPKEVRAVNGRHYVFHNSFCTHGDYLRNWLLKEFVHRNNALRFAMAGELGLAPAQLGTMFGDLHVPPGQLTDRFTSDWRALGITMEGDVVAHPEWPAAIQAAGYTIRPATGTTPMFVNPFVGDLTLDRASPCRGAGLSFEVELVDGSIWRAASGSAVGAWQEGHLYGGPTFVATP